MLTLGTIIKPYGRIIAVAFITGERYYFLSDGKSVAMMPAFMIEEMLQTTDIKLLVSAIASPTVIKMKSYTQYECSSGRVGLGHSSHYTGARPDDDVEENCICGQPLVEVLPDGYRYKVTFESINPHQAAEMEALYGRDIWQKLNDAEWDALNWHPVTSGQSSPNVLRDQYQRLLEWSRTHEQPIRNVKFHRAQTTEWEEVRPSRF